MLIVEPQVKSHPSQPTFKNQLELFVSSFPENLFDYRIRRMTWKSKTEKQYEIIDQSKTSCSNFFEKLMKEEKFYLDIRR